MYIVISIGMRGLKRCARCGFSKPFSEFTIDRAQKGGLRTHCISCSSFHKRRWTNRLKTGVYEVDSVPNLHTKIDYCLICGRVFPGSGKKEVCGSSVCYQSRNNLRAYKRISICQAYKDRLRGKGCICCGYDKCVNALEFHHLECRKGCAISKISTLPKLRREIANYSIVVLCANCHREVHAGMIDEAQLFPRKLVNFAEQIALVG